MTHAFSLIRFLGCLLVAGVLLAGSSTPALAQEGQARGTGWLCGVVLDEAGGFASEATLTVFPEGQPKSVPPEPVAAASSDPRGSFCFKDLSPGFYDLQVAKQGWLLQLPQRHVEVRAGLVNRLTPIELELEPGDPRVSIAESFDGMPLGQARGMLEELLRKGDRDSLAEAARRLLPKRGVRFELARLPRGMDPKPLVDLLLRRLDGVVLPPLKTARYLYVVAELSDPRNEGVIIPLLLNKLRDGRRLPAVAVPSEGPSYVSDIAMQELTRLAGKSFRWKFGQTPLQNGRSISSAQAWWRDELRRRSDRQR